MGGILKRPYDYPCPKGQGFRPRMYKRLWIQLIAMMLMTAAMHTT